MHPKLQARGVAMLVGVAIGAGAPNVGSAQNATIPYLIDSNGKQVGYFLGKNSVVLKRPYSTEPIEATFYATGFTPPDGNFDVKYLFTSTNCTGTKYLDAAGFPVHAYVNPANPIDLQYAGANPTTIQVLSYKVGTSTCIATTPISAYAAPLVNLSLKAFGGGFMPPFTVVYK